MRAPYGQMQFDGDKVICHVRRRAFGHLGGHVVRTHELSADEYREMFGLNRTTGLIGPSLRERRQAHSGQLTHLSGSDGSQSRGKSRIWREEGRENVRARRRNARGQFQPLGEGPYVGKKI